MLHPTSSNPQQPSSATDASVPEPTIENAIEHAKRAFALKKYEQAVEHYASALELITEKHGESAPETADLYFSYGRALLENAISHNSVLGKEQPDEDADDAHIGKLASTNDDSVSASVLLDERVKSDWLIGGYPSTASNRPILSFSGDVDEDGDEDPEVDLLEQANRQIEEAERDEEEEEAEPEDDFNAAWEVLDLARAIYARQGDDVEVRLKLADTYMSLGDVSLETEKFDQAITDYSAGLKLKEELLPVSSRHIAEAHYKLSMVLDLSSGRLSESIIHAEKALESVASRISELRAGLSGQLSSDGPEKEGTKGKGKATTKLVRDGTIQSMTRPQMESELKELEGLREDLALKVEELKVSPNENLGLSAPTLAAQALDKELNAGPSTPLPAPAQATVNDLTSMVKKKKKAPEPPAEESAQVKRKADADADTSTEKKARLDTPKS
ncbi:hypothetical protein AMATHDRAFT_2671 [Amanita thiersii Skay4041]|uniref:Tetratricopeptide SHNi-TPR domain-containing protein n=1 Tax=Amanita thiersii Skay4041 TaxID=703135 RepID=A0A2A9NPD8_9AGAR|nr:hypothetical protein AMATHDRAFT_2671 [Amanita thiersii Skay4041]